MKARKAHARDAVVLSSLGICLLIFLAVRSASADTPPGSWTLFADKTNGLPSSVAHPSITINAQTHMMYYASWLPPKQTDTLGSVYACDLNDPTHKFTLLSQLGFVLPTAFNGTAKLNVMGMTTNAAGEPIVGCANDGGNSSDAKLYSFDSATNHWVTPTLQPQPYQSVRQVTRGPDGTIWTGGVYSYVYKSTDGGRTFTTIDESSLLAATHPGYYGRIGGGGNDGAIFNIQVAPNGYVYCATETGGWVYSPDNGATWNPLDYDYNNPNSTMAIVSHAGNVSGLGFTKNGKIVVQGGGGSIDPTYAGLYLVDPVAHTVQACNGFPAYYLGMYDIYNIVTAPDGRMFFNSGRKFTPAGQVAGNGQTYSIDTGGVYTSSDGLNWTPFNTGITYTGGATVGAPDNIYLDGNNVYVATDDRQIYVYTVPEPAMISLLLAGLWVMPRRGRRA